MMTARDEILERLRRQKRIDLQPPAWQSRRHFDDLGARFAQSLAQAKGEVRRAADLPEALAHLDGLIEELGARRIVVNGEPPLLDTDLADRWPQLEWHTVRTAEPGLRQFCATADLGISGAVAALAETGTLVVRSGPNLSRLATLLPPVHAVLLPESLLLTDIFAYFDRRDGTLPANLTFISGPSKTADIEQTLAVGVHGPRRLVVILYGQRAAA